MLVLSRKPDEQIVIRFAGIEVVITLVELRGDKARIGIQAPRSVSVHRREVQEAVDRETAQAAAALALTESV